jgi:hypothetical protein
MAELRARARRESAAAAVFEARARVAAELAGRALDPSEPFLSGRADAIACELYRQSIHWALRALDAQRAVASAPAVAEPLGEASAPGAAEALLDARRPTAGARDALSRTFVEFAELAPQQQARTARELGAIAESLLRDAASTRREMDTIWFGRSFRIAAILLVVSVAVVFLALSKTWREQRADLAAGRSWSASSSYPGVGCRSPAQECVESPDFFFHTNEEDKPWVVIDLGAPELVGAVRIDNRKDCCGDRAVPLVVELSSDGKRFRQVNRLDEKFKSWRAEFAPMPARYVRVSSPRRTLLHLARIRVLPK